ncbi:cupin domain-containing protein [Gloeocapsopsis crepidinum LEGE 06123]|uniref:Cupin domain-containing protein n=1 Tax=Gloeocapsopsis crepidinum LEGE 06123 TaxID=588587 RepID=A0ABR9ULU4_9CHRO|nr:cupin domain-containing protein [Gloeocapsopsis crepidinum]MBE9189261.1 cupin domain-containing protein [Gloeocapsopsis crepidinum LEGE 06123]
MTSTLQSQQASTMLNSVTGDRMTIFCTTQDSHGKSFKAQYVLPPKANGSPLHYHNSITETFEVLSGSLEMELGTKGNIKILQPGEIVCVPAGMPHSFRNSSNNEVIFVSEVLPPRQFEQFIRAMYGLANDGRVNQAGMPTNILHLAVILQKADLVLVAPPLFMLVQKLIITSLARLAYLLGVERSLVKYWSN